MCGKCEQNRGKKFVVKTGSRIFAARLKKIILVLHKTN